MTVLSTMPDDGNCVGHVIVGDEDSSESLAWGTVRPTPMGVTAKPAGRISVRCFMDGFDTWIVSQESTIHKGFGMESHNLYWLPWGDGTVASVPWATLNLSSLFLTSTFTGCRFVVNQTGVAHVAYGMHPVGVHGSSAARDQAEVAAGSGNPAGGGRRRTLSITGPIAARPNEQRITYNVGAESCVVVGWKAADQWTFICLVMQDGNRMRSRWTTLGVVDVGGGNIAIA